MKIMKTNLKRETKLEMNEDYDKLKGLKDEQELRDEDDVKDDEKVKSEDKNFLNQTEFELRFSTKDLVSKLY